LLTSLGFYRRFLRSLDRSFEGYLRQYGLGFWRQALSGGYGVSFLLEQSAAILSRVAMLCMKEIDIDKRAFPHYNTVNCWYNALVIGG